MPLTTTIVGYELLNSKFIVIVDCQVIRSQLAGVHYGELTPSELE